MEFGVVGIHNAALLQKLMRDDSLTLDKTVKQAKAGKVTSRNPLRRWRRWKN